MDGIGNKSLLARAFFFSAFSANSVLQNLFWS